MSEVWPDRIEAGVDAVAASALAAAVGVAVLSTISPGVAWALAAIAFLGAWQALRRVERGANYFHLSPFAPIALKFTPALPELLLTDLDRVRQEPEEEPLVLTDILKSVGPDARVVRLFDPAAMPTPGQLKHRIDRHLDATVSSLPSPDASEALYAALNELRLSLR